MGKKNSSRQRHSKKVNTQNRFTMSSTTEAIEATDGDEPDGVEGLIVRRVGPRLLSDEEQQAYLQLLLRGASPVVVCRQVGVPYSAVRLTLRESAEFRDDHDDAMLLLNQNVEAALYGQAMQGSVPAMTLWLRNRPPPYWRGDEDDKTVKDEFERMNDAELVEAARAAGITVPLAYETGIAATDGEVLPD